MTFIGYPGWRTIIWLDGCMFLIPVFFSLFSITQEMKDLLLLENIFMIMCFKIRKFWKKYFQITR